VNSIVQPDGVAGEWRGRVAAVRRELTEHGPPRSPDAGPDFATVTLPELDCDQVRDLLVEERVGTVVEIGLAYASSALAISEALLRTGSRNPRHVVIDPYPSAVTATLTGTRHRTAHALLTTRGFETIDEHTLVLARIDHEEPYWANKAAQALTAEGITTEITPRLREAINEEWTWANYPMPWCTRAEIREVSNEAQKIHDDIRHGRLVIHAHAGDNGTTVAIGTYRDSNKSVYLHGENHLRQIADTFDSPAQALATFEHLHGDTMRPGPAPMTDTERQTAEARTTLSAPTAEKPEQPVQRTETVPAYSADPGDHALLNRRVEADLTGWRDEQVACLLGSQAGTDRPTAGTCSDGVD
jgi:hypothetical protein